MPVFQSLRSRIHNLLRGPDSVQRVANMLHHWALWKAHMKMRDYIREAEYHPGLSTEVRRAPMLLQLFLRHLRENAHLHIDVQKNTFFDEDVIGNPDSWKLWQENGYSLERTSENYSRRVQRWANYFNAQRQTYERMIELRNQGYENATIVPYWELWNSGVLDDDPGYPSYTGLHYIDKADQDLPQFMQQASQHLETYAINKLMGIEQLPAPFRTTQWLSVLRKSMI